MRIFTTIRHSIDPKFYYGALWSGNFYPALKQLGHEIIESQIDLLPASRFMHIAKDFTQKEQSLRAEITQKIIDEVRETHQKKPIDLFLSYFYNAHFDPAGFDEIRRLGIPTVNFYCNSIYQFKYVEAIAQKVKFSWHTERDARSTYLKAGANPVWVQMGADPEIYHPVEGLSREHKACFIGQRYADRDRHLAKLIQNQIPIDIYGNGWKALNGNSRYAEPIEASDFYLGRKVLKPASLESYFQMATQNFQGQGILNGSRRTFRQWQYRIETRRLDGVLAQVVKGAAGNMAETLSQYEVVLNFSNVWSDGRSGSTLIPHVRLRDFEAPMCRTCYLTGHSDEIEEFYEIGKEIDTYQNPEELVEKTKFYLSHPDQAEKLRRAGYDRARRDHTWTQRFQRLFNEIDVGRTTKWRDNTCVTPTTLPISAIVPTLNRHHSLSRMLKSLANQSAQPVEMIIIDASTDDETKKLCEKSILGLKTRILYHRAIKVGAASQRNQAIQHASQEAIWFIDDDVIFEPDCLKRLWVALHSDAKLGGANAMTVNQKYSPPGLASRLLYRFLNGSREESYAGKFIKPVLNLLPEDRPDLPEVVPVEWLSTTCVLYRSEALPNPPFPSHFTGYSMMEDVALSLIVGKRWRLANARTARIFHDSQSGDPKNKLAKFSEMKLVNRHYVMTSILNQKNPVDYLKLAVLEMFELLVSLSSLDDWRSLPVLIRGKLRACWKIWRDNQNHCFSDRM